MKSAPRAGRLLVLGLVALGLVDLGLVALGLVALGLVGGAMLLLLPTPRLPGRLLHPGTASPCVPPAPGTVPQDLASHHQENTP